MNENDLLSYLNIGLPEDIQRLKIHGDLDAAIRRIDQMLEGQELVDEMRYCLQAEREIMRRIPANYPFTVQTALEKVRAYIPDYTQAELEALMDTGRIVWTDINGERRISELFWDSMCKTMPELQERSGIPLPGVQSAAGETPRGILLNRAMQTMKEEGSLAYRIRLRASVRIKDEVFVPGMFARVHLPIPAACDQQSDICVESVSPAGACIAPEDALQRTVCWEETMQENHGFSVVYSYISSMQWQDTEHPAGENGKETGKTLAARSDFAACLGELEPHIVFTPYIRALAERLSEGCDTPLEKARAFYDYITLHCKYTYVPAYITLERIADTCAKSLRGDCGIFALLFITMCRYVGIPAQWQSGLVAEPGYAGSHDWARFYCEPFGWLYADPSFGVGAARVGNEERRRFYFGNLDPYRMVANNAFQAPFTTQKKYWRADPYDNQQGEIETAERGLRYEEYDRAQEILACEAL